MFRQFVIFTDLDGTLLDHTSYSFEAALPALVFIKSQNIPLVICTSKTRAEIEIYRELLENSDPFISENGGGIFVPENYFSDDFHYDKKKGEYKTIELGVRHEKLIEALNSIKTDTGLQIKSLSDMTLAEISEAAGLSVKQAALARMREYDEPFLPLGDENGEELVKSEIKKRGFTHTEGGRFHHIMGDNDKGKAVAILTELFKKDASEIKTIGIGDSLNDLPMLQNVDSPILVKKPDGTHDPRIRFENLTLAAGIGPEGWNGALLHYFGKT